MRIMTQLYLKYMITIMLLYKSAFEFYQKSLSKHSSCVNLIIESNVIQILPWNCLENIKCKKKKKKNYLEVLDIFMFTNYLSFLFFKTVLNTNCLETKKCVTEVYDIYNKSKRTPACIHAIDKNIES